MVGFWCMIMIYLTFAAIFVTVKSIQNEAREGNFTFATLFQNLQFFSIFVSLLTTYVFWFLASILFFDPWHMFTCVSLLPPFTPYRWETRLIQISSYNISFSRQHTSTFSTSTPSVTPMTLHGEPRETINLKNCPQPTLNQVARLMLKSPRMMEILTPSTKLSSRSSPASHPRRSVMSLNPRSKRTTTRVSEVPSSSLGSSVTLLLVPWS